MRSLLRSLLVASLAASSACSTSFLPFRFIEKPRVVGATVTVDVEPARARPAPGESARITLITADPGKRQYRTYMLAVCVPGDSSTNIVQCMDATAIVGGGAVTVLPSAGDPFEEPHADFTVPDLATLDGAEELWLFGAVCNAGTVRNVLTDPPVRGQPFNPCLEDPTADPQPYGQLITTRIKLQIEPNDTNYTPALATLTLEGDPMPVYETGNETADVTGCKGNAAYYQVVTDGVHVGEFVATATPASFESYVHGGETATRAEDLYFRLYFTAGSSNNEYDYLAVEHTEAKLLWRPPPPEAVDPTGTLVRFYGQIADERHAVDQFQFAICVVSSP